jgi:hypothetical protein
VEPPEAEALDTEEAEAETAAALEKLTWRAAKVTKQIRLVRCILRNKAEVKEDFIGS